MIVLKSKNGITVVPEMPIGTRFKIKDWLNGMPFPAEKRLPKIEFEVTESFPDETGDVPCNSEMHQCAFYGLCGGVIDCICLAKERKDGKSVRYVEFIDGQEYHF
ncbi:MAG: hypothetical protein IKO36_11425 [Bacteroidaceae bacterium]|nr:hypothetical protein [Bacteroidaceae bacterium]